MRVSILIGAVGGFFGGKMVAPMFIAAAAVPGDFSSPALFFAAAGAAAFLAVGNLVYSRWGVESRRRVIADKLITLCRAKGVSECRNKCLCRPWFRRT